MELRTGPIDGVERQSILSIVAHPAVGVARQRSGHRALHKIVRYEL